VQTVAQYAASVVEKYQIEPDVGSAPHKAADAIIPMLKKWGGKELLGITLSGAYAKGTAVSLSSNVDILISLRLPLEMEVRAAFWKLFEFLSDENLKPRTRNVSIQVQSKKLRVDVVPAWAAEAGDHLLYHKEPGGPVRTNVGHHVRLITNSGRAQEICALKIWRERHELEFPSFYLELTTLQALEGERFGQLGDNLMTTLRYLSERFVQTVLRDPANKDNVISDELTADQKKTIASEARKALEENKWEKILW
jgi:hypothetical protein